MTRTLSLCLPVCLLLLMPSILTGQEKVSVQDSLRKSAANIFIDCPRCDMNYIRAEIPYVNYVRDVREADVYILETQQGTGSGGNQYTITFHGQGRFTGMDDTLVYNSRPDDTFDLTREGRTKMLSLGLMRYVAKTPIYSEVAVSHQFSGEEEEVVDNWNYWVFEIDFDPNFEIEQTRREIVWESSLLASRITPEWKFEFEFDQNFRSTRFSYSDTVFTKYRRSWSQDNLIVKSLSEHWSTGVMFDLTSSSYRNIYASFDILPAVEYNIFPYSESTRRQLRVLYGIGYTYNKYIGITYYDKLRENLFLHQLDIAYRVQQKWGSINLSLEASNYLHDFTKNRLELDGSVRIRIIKGLSFQVRGSAALIHDQIYLAKGDLDPTEVLLELQEMETNYSFDGGIGFTYTFGSIYNNIVNPRFGNGY